MGNLEPRWALKYAVQIASRSYPLKNFCKRFSLLRCVILEGVGRQKSCHRVRQRSDQRQALKVINLMIKTSIYKPMYYIQLTLINYIIHSLCPQGNYLTAFSLLIISPFVLL